MNIHCRKNSDYNVTIQFMAHQIHFTYDTHYHCSGYLFVRVMALYCEDDKSMFTRIVPNEDEPSQFSGEELRQGQWCLHAVGKKMLFDFSHFVRWDDHLLRVDLRSPYKSNIPKSSQDVREKILKEGRWNFRYIILM